MATISDALAIAVQHHQAGRLELAAEIYRRILIVDPNQPDALHLLGVVACQRGNNEAGIEYMRRAIAIDDTDAAFHNNLGDAYRNVGRTPEAVACYRRALELKPDYVRAYNNLGSAFHRQGKLEEALACYRRALDLEPNFADACGNLGNALREQGKLDEAVACYRRALELEPAFVEAQTNLGVALRDQGKLDEAVACYRRALELKPSYVEAHNNLGIVLRDQGKLEEALACYRRALELEPDFVEANINLGVALRDMGKLDEAVVCCRRALRLRPDFTQAHYNMGITLQEQGKLDEAIACYRRTVELDPDFFDAHNNLGVAFKDQGKLDEAVACCQQALELKPDSAEAHSNLGIALQAQGKLEMAVACYQRALKLKPGFAEACYNLGSAFRDGGKLDEAVAWLCRAVELNPEFAQAHSNLGSLFKEQGQLDEAFARYHRALDLKPDFTQAHSALLCALHYQDGASLTGLAAAHREFEQRHAAPLRSTRPAHANTRDPDRRLRLGFLSPDFARHPVGYFLISALESLDREQCATVCYNDRLQRDDLTNRFQAAASTWRNVYLLSDEQLAAQICADKIDILFDLAGHTDRNRLLVFARKPAPIQITWLGYVGTTGLQAMDYIMADKYEIPAGAEGCYCERVLRLPDDYVCYAPPEYAPPVGPLPAITAGHVTFASFNNPAKITASAVELWADTLLRLPGSRLVLKYRGLDGAATQQRYWTLFAAKGVAAERVELLGSSPHVDLLACYDRVDIALDPFPYAGGLTTCEALWMGVPVIALPGETFASRHSLTHLTNIGLTETIARNRDEYVELAVSLASDLARLGQMRVGLREQVARSPLCDGQRFAANLLALLRGVWRRWCESICSRLCDRSEGTG
jgi:protein O-GlcNAc transferase